MKKLINLLTFLASPATPQFPLARQGLLLVDHLEICGLGPDSDEVEFVYFQNTAEQTLKLKDILRSRKHISDKEGSDQVHPLIVIAHKQDRAILEEEALLPLFEMIEIEEEGDI